MCICRKQNPEDKKQTQQTMRL